MAVANGSASRIRPNSGTVRINNLNTMNTILETIMKYLFTIAVIFLIVAEASHAHEWKADAWAKKQVTLTAEVMSCVEYIRESKALFYTECNNEDLLKRSLVLGKELVSETRHHSPDEKIGDFINKDFKDKRLGIEAIMSTSVTMKGMRYINKVLDNTIAVKKKDTKVYF